MGGPAGKEAQTRLNYCYAVTFCVLCMHAC